MTILMLPVNATESHSIAELSTVESFIGNDSSFSAHHPKVNYALAVQSIKKYFNEHYDYLTSEMYRRLIKDADGNNDTYVLYDVQTYLQNVVIYADENNDIEMLTKLLSLVKIAFQPQHMTDGKWLNNSHGLVGKEVDLVIAQFFNLLTRVLSACERHGITTNLSDHDMNVIVDHINYWVSQKVRRGRVDDRHLFFVQSVLLFHDYLVVIK